MGRNRESFSQSMSLTILVSRVQLFEFRFLVLFLKIEHFSVVLFAAGYVYLQMRCVRTG